MNIYCCECEKEVDAVLTNGSEIYPHRKDLYTLPFWKCITCNNFVGCHHKTKNQTKPLGVIPTKEIKSMRIRLHGIIDPLWKDGIIERAKLYKLISNHIGYQYHTANIKSVQEANSIIEVALKISSDFLKAKP